jgi:hypothetical protein
VVGVEVDVTGMGTLAPRELTEHYAQPARAQRLRGMSPEDVRLEHKKILDRFGVSPDTPVPIDFDILLKVEPWHPNP